MQVVMGDIVVPTHSKLDVLLEWKEVSVSQSHAGSEADAQGQALPTKFKLDSHFGDSFYHRFSNLLGTMA